LVIRQIVLCPSSAQNLWESPGALVVVAELQVTLPMPGQVEPVFGNVAGDVERLGMIKELSGVLWQAFDFSDELERLTPRYCRGHLMEFMQAGANDGPELVHVGIRNYFCGAHIPGSGTRNISQRSLFFQQVIGPHLSVAARLSKSNTAMFPVWKSAAAENGSATHYPLSGWQAGSCKL
jgi:hypothetical protein